jgi:hypothetical protein
MVINRTEGLACTCNEEVIKRQQREDSTQRSEDSSRESFRLDAPNVTTVNNLLPREL